MPSVLVNFNDGEAVNGDCCVATRLRRGVVGRTISLGISESFGTVLIDGFLLTATVFFRLCFLVRVRFDTLRSRFRSAVGISSRTIRRYSFLSADRDLRRFGMVKGREQ